MANLGTTLKVLLKNEGGYNCAFSGSGETYKGIDRNYSQKWAGWQIIDTAKQTGKIDASCSRRGEQYLKSNALDTQVGSWYRAILLPYFANFGVIKNQTLATFVADFVWHKPYRAIYFCNLVAKAMRPSVITSENYISAGVVNVMNNNSPAFYKALVAYRLAYYNNPSKFSSTWPERFTTSLQGLINRVNSFPATLSIWSWF